MYNRTKSFSKTKAEIGNRRQGNSKERGPKQGDKHTHIVDQADTIMAYKGKTASKKMTKQLDGMNAEQLQALASMMTGKMKEPEGHPGTAAEWKKRLHHVNRVKDERTVKIKPGDNYMENLKK